MTQSQTNYLNKNGILTPKQRNVERFDAWMKAMKNKFYADNKRMQAAYELID